MSNCIHTLHYHHSCNGFFNSFLHKALLGSPCCLYSYWWACYSSPCSCYFLHLDATLYLLLHLTQPLFNDQPYAENISDYSSSYFLPPFFTFFILEMLYMDTCILIIPVPQLLSPSNPTLITHNLLPSSWSLFL